ncbi:MAG: efflux RND transporter permease subunit [Pseudomonadota bacterium]
MFERLNLSSWAISNRSLMFFLMVVITGLGTGAFLKLGRAEDPSFAIKTMVVSAVWPGATTEDMETQVADRIESRIQDLPNLDYIETYSKPNQTFIRVQLEDTMDPNDIEDLWYQVRKKVGDISGTLPQGVIGPFFNDEYSDVSFAVYALTSKDASQDDLVAYSERARQRLERVEAVEKVEILGEQDRKIYVELSYAKLATLGIPPEAIFRSLDGQNAVVPSGSVETAGPRVQIRVEGALGAAEDVANVPVEANGRTFRLGDIAEVYRGVVDPASYVIRHNGVAGLALSLTMEEGANGLALGEALKPAVEDIEAFLPVGVDWSTVSNQPKVIAYSFNEFIIKIAAALGIVLVVSFVSLGWRTGIVVALAVPLTLAVTFVVMEQMGTSLERISLGALILSLGLLVDDAIIAVEMMVVKLEEGSSREDAGSYAWTHTAFPMLTGTLVTAAGFLPVGFAMSTAGEYAGGIFWVVMIALVASWFVAVLFTPVLGVALLPSTEWYAKRHAGHGDMYDGQSYRLLRQVATFCMRKKWPTVAGVLGLFVLAGAGFTMVPQQFFPTSSRPEVLVEITLPEGSSFEATREATNAVEEVLAQDEEVKYYTSYIGAGAPRFFLALDPLLPNEKRALIVAQSADAKARDRIIKRMRSIVDEGAFPGTRVRMTKLLYGPPVPFPVEFRVLGDDPDKVREIAYQVREVMDADAEIRDSQLLWEEEGGAVRFEIDQDRLRALGLTPREVGLTTQTFLSGAAVTQVRDGLELIDVVVRAPESERTDLSSIEDLTITTPRGDVVPLSQVAKPVYGHERAISWRRNRDVLLSVRADVADGVQGADVTARLLPELESIKSALPAGYRIETSGVVEESAKANAALLPMFPIMALAMLTLLIFQLKTVSRTFLVFLTSPLGFIGAVFALLITQKPFGFVALLGLIAIGGMIMRNSVILIDQIAQDVDAGKDEWNSVIETTVSRARPVILTALAAILGFMPLTLSSFWGPMAVAMIGGLIIATILTLTALPALYVLWFRVQETGARDRTHQDVAHGALAPAE